MSKFAIRKPDGNYLVENGFYDEYPRYDEWVNKGKLIAAVLSLDYIDALTRDHICKLIHEFDGKANILTKDEGFDYLVKRLLKITDGTPITRIEYDGKVFVLDEELTKKKNGEPDEKKD